MNDLASRMVVQGTSETAFSPDASITRAEFAAIIVRGLGFASDWTRKASLQMCKPRAGMPVIRKQRRLMALLPVMLMVHLAP